MTRKFLGITFEGETKDADGGVFMECKLEDPGLAEDVSRARDDSSFKGRGA